MSNKFTEKSFHDVRIACSFLNVLLKINNRLMSKLFGLCQGLTMRIK